MMHDLLEVVAAGLFGVLMVLVGMAATCLVAYGFLSL